MKTALKLMSCETCAPGEKNNPKGVDNHCDVSALQIPKSPHMHPFHFLDEDNSVIEEISRLQFDSGPVESFRKVTGIDPESTKIEGLVVFNIYQLAPMFGEIWKQFGPFPFIASGSEGLTSVVDEDTTASSLSEEVNLRSTSGFVITSSRNENYKVASLILTSDKETELEAKLGLLTKAGFSPKNSFGIALTSCMRGYEGFDILPEHVDKRNEIQRAECRYMYYMGLLYFSRKKMKNCESCKLKIDYEKMVNIFVN